MQRLEAHTLQRANALARAEADLEADALEVRILCFLRTRLRCLEIREPFGEVRSCAATQQDCDHSLRHCGSGLVASAQTLS